MLCPWGHYSLLIAKHAKLKDAPSGVVTSAKKKGLRRKLKLELKIKDKIAIA